MIWHISNAHTSGIVRDRGTDYMCARLLNMIEFPLHVWCITADDCMHICEQHMRKLSGGVHICMCVNASGYRVMNCVCESWHAMQCLEARRRSREDLDIGIGEIPVARPRLLVNVVLEGHLWRFGGVNLVRVHHDAQRRLLASLRRDHSRNATSHPANQIRLATERIGR